MIGDGTPGVSLVDLELERAMRFWPLLLRQRMLEIASQEAEAPFAEKLHFDAARLRNAEKDSPLWVYGVAWVEN